MSRAIATFTAASFLCAACAPPLSANAPLAQGAPPAHLLLATAAADATPPPPPPAPPPPPPPPPPASEVQIAQASQSSTSATTPPSEANEERHAASAMPRAIGWYAIGLGAASGIIAIGTSIMMLHQANLRSEDCNAQKVCTPDGYDASQQLDKLSGWNVGTYIAAAVGLGVGTILVVTHPKKDMRASLNVTTNGLEIRGTF